MEEKGSKKEMEKMVEERREFPKEEFSGFGYVKECSETRCALFIVVVVDLNLMPKIFLVYIFDIF